MNNNTKYSIQDITERKNNKKSELSASKKIIQELTQNLFSPPEAKKTVLRLLTHCLPDFIRSVPAFLFFAIPQGGILLFTVTLT